jgi:hypothetical protein
MALDCFVGDRCEIAASLPPPRNDGDGQSLKFE